MHVISVHLTGVHLMGVYLIGVRLIGVHITGAYLIGVHLTGYASLIAEVINSRSYLARIIPQILQWRDCPLKVAASPQKARISRDGQMT
jgi:hypothetical protein